MEKEPIKSHKDLKVYQMAFDAAMKIFELSKKFPVEERYSLTDQIRRSSRSVCANMAEAWRKRRYEAAFVAKLNDCESEAAETQTWIEFAVKCNYLVVCQPKNVRWGQALEQGCRGAEERTKIPSSFPSAPLL